MSFKHTCQLVDMINISTEEGKIQEERSDVCIYKTLRYPPRSAPPAA